MLVKMENPNGGGSEPIEFTSVLSSNGGVVFDTESVNSILIKFTGRDGSGDTVRVNVSNSPYTTATDMYHYGTNVKNFSSIMSDYVDLLALSEVSGYRYIGLNSDRTASMTIVETKIS